MEAIKANNPDLAEKLASEHMNNAYSNMVKNRLYDLYKTDNAAAASGEKTAEPAKKEL
mgnify:CR=1 FL=1